MQPYERRGAMRTLRVKAALEAGAPKILLRLLVLIVQLPGLMVQESIDVLEVFAGRRRITKAIRSLGYRAVPFDKCMSDRMDINTDEGFCILLALALALAPGGLLWLAPTCSSWVWINSGTHMRNFVTWAGNTDHAYIRSANKMVSRCALLIWIVTLRGGSWALEQPRSSVLEAHDRLQEIFRKTKVFWSCACMGAFRGTSLKPLQFWSSATWIGELSKYKVKNKTLRKSQTYKRYMNKRGWAVDGNLGALRDTQSYTRRFGRVVASIYDQGRVVPPPPAAGVGSDDDMSLLEMLSSDDSWQDAELDSVFAFLRGSAAP